MSSVRVELSGDTQMMVNAVNTGLGLRGEGQR